MTCDANKWVRIFPQAKNATFWLDEMAKTQPLHTHTPPWLGCSYQDAAPGATMASEGARKTNTRDQWWTQSEENRRGLHLAENLPEPPHDHPSKGAKTTWSALLTSAALPNRDHPQQVTDYLLPRDTCPISLTPHIFRLETVLYHVNSFIPCIKFPATGTPERLDRNICWYLTS